MRRIIKVLGTKIKAFISQKEEALFISQPDLVSPLPVPRTDRKRYI